MGTKKGFGISSYSNYYQTFDGSRVESYELLKIDFEELTILLLASLPPPNLLQSSNLPQSLAPGLRILQALLDLHTLTLFDMHATDSDITFRSVICLVPSPVLVVNILANDVPVIGIEDVLAEDAVGVFEAVEEKSVFDMLVSYVPGMQATEGVTCVLYRGNLVNLWLEVATTYFGGCSHHYTHN